MQTKTFEVRDTMTFIAVMAIKLDPVTEGDDFLIRRTGYSPPDNYIILMRLDAINTATYSPYVWTTNTMVDAHKHIYDHFNELESGSVIDVEFLRGETTSPKNSERVK